MVQGGLQAVLSCYNKFVTNLLKRLKLRITKRLQSLGDAPA